MYVHCTHARFAVEQQHTRRHPQLRVARGRRLPVGGTLARRHGRQTGPSHRLKHSLGRTHGNQQQRIHNYNITLLQIGPRIGQCQHNVDFHCHGANVWDHTRHVVYLCALYRHYGLLLFVALGEI